MLLTVDVCHLLLEFLPRLPENDRLEMKTVSQKKTLLFVRVFVIKTQKELEQEGLDNILIGDQRWSY